jgi:NAD(P)-dependent dehydrogenase (short-subunit alcohol dehydrogenase family)
VGVGCHQLGDPLDVLVLMDEPAFPGCKLTCRLVGVIEGEQGAKKKLREGADILVSYYNEHEDAKETQRLVESASRRCLLVSGDIKYGGHCRDLIARAAEAFVRIDILVNNAAHQSFDSPEEISDEEWDVTFRTNIHAMYR